MRTEKITPRVAVASREAPVLVIGAGPAGLTAALHLAELNVPVMVIEANPRVGGLAQTAEYKGFRFDIGGHRFYTKVPEVQALWQSVLGREFLRRPRLSRIFFDGKYFDYPLKPLVTLNSLGIVRSVSIVLSYLWAQLWPVTPEVSFRDWVSNRFGRKLFRMFFETYTEKVWGIPCHAISARWAAQRIQGLSLRTAVMNMLAPWFRRRADKQVKSLINEFDYPRLGPGMMWEAFAERIEQLGGTVLLNARVRALLHDREMVSAVEIEHDGARFRQRVSKVISTMALRDLVRALGPRVPAAVQDAAQNLKYRDFITVAVIVDRAELFPDNWIYVHDPAVKIGRIQNFKNWSPDMVPDLSKTCLGLEYFCTIGDALWSLTDEQLVALAKRELCAIGLAQPEWIVDATVVRMPKAYPVYDEAHEAAVAAVRAYIGRFTNLLTIGRNGTHTYNNQDHSMVMGMLAVRNLCGERHDLWAVGASDEYLEVSREEHGRSAAWDLRGLGATQPHTPPLIHAREACEPQSS